MTERIFGRGAQRNPTMAQGESPTNDQRVIEIPYGNGVVRQYIQPEFRTITVLEASNGDYCPVLYNVHSVSDIEFITPDGKTFSFASQLPEGWQIEWRDGWDNAGINPEKKIITYGSFYKDYQTTWRGKIKRQQRLLFTVPGAFLLLFHELGHVKIGKQSEDLKSRLREERKSWAFAIKAIRELRQQGIDLEPEIKSDKGLLRHVLIRLTSHELDLSFAFLGLGEKEEKWNRAHEKLMVDVLRGRSEKIRQLQRHSSELLRSI